MRAGDPAGRGCVRSSGSFSFQQQLRSGDSTPRAGRRNPAPPVSKPRVSPPSSPAASPCATPSAPSQRTPRLSATNRVPFRTGAAPEDDRLNHSIRHQRPSMSSISSPIQSRRVPPESPAAIKPRASRPGAISPDRQTSVTAPTQSSLARQARQKAAVNAAAEDCSARGDDLGTPNWLRWAPPPSNSPRNAGAAAGISWNTCWTPPAVAVSNGSGSPRDEDVSPESKTETALQANRPPSLVLSSADCETGENFVCDADLNIQRYMWPSPEGLVALGEDTRKESTPDDGPSPDTPSSSSRCPASKPSSELPSHVKLGAVTDSPAVHRHRQLFYSNRKVDLEGVFEPSSRRRSNTWHSGEPMRAFSRAFSEGALETISELQDKRKFSHFKDKEHAVTSVIADNALEKSAQLIKELMRQGLWEDDDESSSSSRFSRHRRTRSTPAATLDSEGLHEHCSNSSPRDVSSSPEQRPGSLESFGFSKASNGENCFGLEKTPGFELPRAQRCDMDRSRSHDSEAADALCPDNWDDPVDYMSADPEVMSSAPEPCYSPRSLSRLSTASMVSGAMETPCDGYNLPREVIEEVARLRQRVCELEEHIRHQDVISLRASLQASSIGSPGRGVPLGPNFGSGPSQDRDSLASTQTPLSPTRMSDRTRMTFSSINSSCDSYCPPKKAFMVRPPPSTKSTVGSSSSGGMLGGNTALQIQEAPPFVPCESNSPLPTSRMSVRGRSIQGRHLMQSRSQQQQQQPQQQQQQHQQVQQQQHPFSPRGQPMPGGSPTPSRSNGRQVSPHYSPLSSPSASMHTAHAAAMQSWGSATPAWAAAPPAASLSPATVSVASPNSLSRQERTSQSPSLAVASVASASMTASSATSLYGAACHAYTLSPQPTHRSVCSTGWR